MQEKFKQFHELIQREFPGIRTELELFSSGAAVLDVYIGEEMYILQYSRRFGIGINRGSKVTFGWEGYEDPFDDFEPCQRSPCFVVFLTAFITSSYADTC
jgi:hypothetical protein